MKEVLDKMQIQTTLKRNHEIIYAPKSKTKKLKCKMHGHNYVLTRAYDNDLPIRVYGCVDCGHVVIRTKERIGDVPILTSTDKLHIMFLNIFGPFVATYTLRAILITIENFWKW